MVKIALCFACEEMKAQEIKWWTKSHSPWVVGRARARTQAFLPGTWGRMAGWSWSSQEGCCSEPKPTATSCLIRWTSLSLMVSWVCPSNSQHVLGGGVGGAKHPVFGIKFYPLAIVWLQTKCYMCPNIREPFWLDLISQRQYPKNGETNMDTETSGDIRRGKHLPIL